MPIAKICGNGLIHFYNEDGTRNLNHPTGFYSKGCEDFLKSLGYKITYSQ